jgi:hypothetical protein
MRQIKYQHQTHPFWASTDSANNIGLLAVKIIKQRGLRQRRPTLRRQSRLPQWVSGSHRGAQGNLQHAASCSRMDTSEICQESEAAMAELLYSTEEAAEFCEDFLSTCGTISQQRRRSEWGLEPGPK